MLLIFVVIWRLFIGLVIRLLCCIRKCLIYCLMFLWWFCLAWFLMNFWLMFISMFLRDYKRVIFGLVLKKWVGVCLLKWRMMVWVCIWKWFRKVLVFVLFGFFCGNWKWKWKVVSWRKVLLFGFWFLIMFEIVFCSKWVNVDWNLVI